MIGMRKDTLVHQFNTARNMVLGLLGKTDEHLMHTIPNGFPNSLHWQFGHVATMGEMLSVTIFKHDNEVHARFNKYFGYGTSPSDFDDDTPTIDDIKQLLEKQLESFESDLTDEQLNMTMDDNQFGAKDNGEFLGFFTIHEAVHVGKMEEMIRVLKQEEQQ